MFHTYAEFSLQIIVIAANVLSELLLQCFSWLYLFYFNVHKIFLCLCPLSASLYEWQSQKKAYHHYICAVQTFL